MRRIRNDQRGLASIIIVAVLITLISLIVLGFASIVRREKRQALDQQLSSQARVAAETAVNEVISRFRADPASVTDQSNCAPVEKTFETAPTDEIQTTCVRINTSPGPLEFDDVTADNSTTVWLDPGNDTIDRLVITWQRSRTNPGSCWTTPYTNLPTFAAGDNMGAVRFDLAHVGHAGFPFTRESLKRNNFGGVLYPRAAGGGTRGETTWTPTFPPSYSNDPAQPVIFGSCDADPATPAATAATYNAHAVIDLPAPPTGSIIFTRSRYMLRLRGLYKPSAIKVIGYTATNDVILFKGAQIAIEATVRVSDVVQRVQVRIPANTPPGTLLPNEAIHVGGSGLCKMLVTEPSSTSDGC